MAGEATAALLKLGVTAGVDYSAQALALFARMTTQPSAARKRRIDTLFTAIKLIGISKFDAFYLLDGDDTQQSFLNIIQDAYNISVVGAGTFTPSIGWAGNGSTGYLDTNFNASTAVGAKFARNSAYFGVWSNTVGQQPSGIAGYRNGTDGVTISNRTSGDGMSIRANQVNVATSTSGTVTDGSGLFSAVRSGASAMAGRHNGVELVTSTEASTAPANGNLRFGNFGTGVFSPVQFKSGIIASFLTAIEEAALYSALATFLSGV